MLPIITTTRTFDWHNVEQLAADYWIEEVERLIMQKSK